MSSFTARLDIFLRYELAECCGAAMIQAEELYLVSIKEVERSGQ
jgi:hypothetical protein